MTDGRGSLGGSQLTARTGPGHPRWPVERTHAWGNQYGTLRWCTERRRIVVQCWLALAAAAIVCGQLVRRAWTSYRWDGRPPAVGLDHLLAQA